MELFQPNNLSRAKPEFTPVHDPNFRRDIAAALGRCYDLPDLSSLRLSGFVGANVISQNFLVEIDSDRYFLKWRRAEDQDRLNQEAKLAVDLARMGLKVPHVISTTSGHHVCVGEQWCGALYVFEDGNYFSGQGKELDSAAEAFGALTVAAQKLFGDMPGEAKPHARSFLAQLGPLLHEAAIGSDPAMASLCQEHQGKVLERLQEVRGERTLIESRLLPMHLDYHPLNLLMRDGKIGCILDLEHLKVYPVSAGLGFAGYKLIRQAMVNEQVRAAEFANPSFFCRWLEGWRKSFPDLQFTPTELGLGARYHVLSLIHFILEAWLRRGDERFKYDLEKQIGSLYEIDAIMERY